MTSPVTVCLSVDEEPSTKQLSDVVLFCVSVEVSTVTVPVFTQSSEMPFRPAEF